MKKLYTKKEFELAKSTDILACECHHCKKSFLVQKKSITFAIKNPNLNKIKFCSQKCKDDSRKTKKLIYCTNCNILFKRNPSEINLNNFCSNSCNAIYCNKNKTHGNRRSKLEKWLEERLTALYPNLEIHYNQKSAINSELDIYISSLNLAFELNGIFHYEPIYGVGKLNQIKDNDVSKSKACHDAKIDLCVIDTSQQKYVKPSTSQKYLDIITDIIKERLLII